MRILSTDDSLLSIDSDMSDKKLLQTAEKAVETHADSDPDEEMTRQKEFKSRNNHYLTFFRSEPPSAQARVTRKRRLRMACRIQP